MHLHGALDARVVRHPDIGIAAADMGEDDAILVLQRGEELRGAVGVAREVAVIVDQRVRRAVDLLALVHEQHVAVAAEPGIARPLVAWEDDERPVPIVLARQPVQLVPERAS